MRRGIFFPELSSLPAIRQAGFDYVLVWNGHNPEPFLNNDLGLKVAIDVRGRENLIPQIRTHPNLAAWYIADEPQTWAEYNALSTVYQTYKPLTSYPIFMANLPWLDDDVLWRSLINLGDIACIDVYPKTITGLYMQNVSDRVKAAKLASPGKQLIYIPQAFSDGYFTRPTGNEYLEMVDRANKAGASGILTFAWDSYITRNVGVIGVTDQDVSLWSAVVEANQDRTLILGLLGTIGLLLTVQYLSRRT